MKFRPSRITALLLLFVALTALGMSFGENVVCAGEMPAAHDRSGASSALGETRIHGNGCPCHPAPEHSSSDHFCYGNCNGPCHAPLSSVSVVFAYMPVGIPLSFSDHKQFIPEVYLSKFIPPQNLA
jgi:hypothetical protein